MVNDSYSGKQFFSESQDHQIASFPEEGCHLVLSPDEKDITLKVCG